MRPARVCLWHECNKTFAPDDGRQRFCCETCQKRRGSWKARRGGTLVDMLLAEDFKGLVEMKAKMKKEIDDATAKNS